MSEYQQLICGIDPGASGGIAFLETDTQFVSVFKMPETEDDLADLLRYDRIVCAYVEAVTPMRAPVDEVGGSRQMGLGSTWKFGQNYGMIRGILAALQIKREFVRPQVWQPALGIPKRDKKSQTEHKNVLKAKAQQLFPGLKVTHAIADALLIAEFGRRQQ